MWPFKKKMTIDYLASVIAEAIEEDVEVFKKAIKEHTAENLTAEEIDDLIPELWLIELSIVDIVLSDLNLRSSANILKNLVPMLVVGYAPLTKERYLIRAEYYAEKIASGPLNEITFSIGEAFVSTSGIDYKNERIDINPQALAWAVSAVATGSLQALGSLIGNIIKDYKVY